MDSIVIVFINFSQVVQLFLDGIVNSYNQYCEVLNNGVIFIFVIINVIKFVYFFCFGFLF